MEAGENGDGLESEDLEGDRRTDERRSDDKSLREAISQGFNVARMRILS